MSEEILQEAKEKSSKEKAAEKKQRSCKRKVKRVL